MLNYAEVMNSITPAALQIKKILVTGGTGFIGKALCARLSASGFQVLVLTRRKNMRSSAHNITYVNKLDELDGISIDVIINLAGETISQRWSQATKKIIYDSRINTTRNIIEYIKSRSQKPQLLISGSAVGFYGTDPQKTFDETTDVSHKEREYAQYLCKAWEEEAKPAELLGIRVVILRMGVVLEKDGGILSKLLPSFYFGCGAQIGDGKQWLSWIARDDLIDLILFIIDHNDMHGAINATAPNPIKNRDFSLELAKNINRPCFFKTPGWILKALFGEMAAELMLQGQKVVPKEALSHGFNFSYPTIESALNKIFIKTSS